MQKYGQKEPPEHAVKNNDIAALRSLRISDIFLNLGKDDRRTHLHYSIVNDCFEIMKMLLRHGHSVDARDSFGRTALHYVAFNNNFKVMKMLRQYHASVNAKSNIGKKPLHRAACNNSIAVIKFLLRNGANIHDKNNGGWTPFHVAAMHNQSEAMKVLLKRGTDHVLRDEDIISTGAVEQLKNHLASISLFVALSNVRG